MNRSTRADRSHQETSLPKPSGFPHGLQQPQVILEDVKQFLKRIIVITVIALSSSAGAQSIFDFSVWGAVQGSYAPLRGTASVGVGYRLPLGVGTVGLEITPFGLTLGDSTRSLFTVAAVLRDVPLPLTPISFRGDIGFEQTYGLDIAGTYSFFAGAGVRYQIFGPLGVTGGARVYLNNPNIFSILIGLDIVI
jgi:hypothetical protein